MFYRRNWERFPIGNPGDAYHLSQGPELINIETTWRCNSNCKMCGHSIPGFTMPSHPDFPMEAIEKLSSFLVTAKTIYFSGYGEPLMHPQLYEIIALAKSMNKAGTVALTSNGTLLSDKNIDKLIQSALDFMEVSFDGYDNEFGHLEAAQVVTNLKNLQDRKRKIGVQNPQVRLTTVLMRNNAGQLKQIIDACIEAGIPSCSILPLRAVPRNPNFNFWDQDVYSNRDYVLPFLEEAIVYGRSRGIEVILLLMAEDLSIDRQRCTSPFTFFHVSTQGDVCMCCDGKAANENIYQRGLWEIWNSDAYKNLRCMVDTESYDQKCLGCTVVQPDTRVEGMSKRHPFLS